MNEELAKKLCLKVVYGGHLSAEEKPVWEAYRQTKTGQAFLQGSNEMKSYLSTMATVDLIPDPPADLKQRFEVIVREGFKQNRSSLWFKVPRWYGTLLIGLLLLLFFWSLFTEGWSTQLSKLLIVIVSLGLPICIGFLLIRHYQKLFSSQTDLAEHFKQAHRRSKKLPSRIAVAVCFIMVPFAFGLFRYHTDGMERAIFEVCGVLIAQCLGLAWCYYLMRRQRRELKASDPDVWEWWENELEN